MTTGSDKDHAESSLDLFGDLLTNNHSRIRLLIIFCEQERCTCCHSFWQKIFGHDKKKTRKIMELMALDEFWALLKFYEGDAPIVLT